MDEEGQCTPLTMHFFIHGEDFEVNCLQVVFEILSKLDVEAGRRVLDYGLRRGDELGLPVGEPKNKEGC